MRFSRLCPLALVAGVAVSLGAQDPVQFTGSPSELVVLSVVVNDRRGRDVPDLGRDRFTLYDDNRAQPITLFSNDDEPVSLGLLIDVSGSMRPKLAEVIVAAAAFARTSNPADELFTITFNENVHEAKGAYTLGPAGVEELDTELRGLRARGETALYDGLAAGLDRLKDAAHTRKVLLVVSDGGDNASEHTLAQVLERARRENVSIYTIGLFEPGGTDKNPKVLQELARATGGARFLPSTPGDLLAICERIAREIRSGYTIAFVPPESDGRYHRVRVDVKTAGSDRLVVRTRPGYLSAAAPPAARGHE